MKPIKQWIEELQLNGDFVADGRKIQDDAFAAGRVAGMREAAEIASNQALNGTEAHCISSAILTAANINQRNET